MGMDHKYQEELVQLGAFRPEDLEFNRMGNLSEGQKINLMFFCCLMACHCWTGCRSSNLFNLFYTVLKFRNAYSNSLVYIFGDNSNYVC